MIGEIVTKQLKHSRSSIADTTVCKLLYGLARRANDDESSIKVKLAFWMKHFGLLTHYFEYGLTISVFLSHWFSRFFVNILWQHCVVTIFLQYDLFHCFHNRNLCPKPSWIYGLEWTSKQATSWNQFLLSFLIWINFHKQLTTFKHCFLLYEIVDLASFFLFFFFPI